MSICSRGMKNEILSIGRDRVGNPWLHLFELFRRAVTIGLLPEEGVARDKRCKDDALTIRCPDGVACVIKGQTPHGACARYVVYPQRSIAVVVHLDYRNFPPVG